MNPDDGYLWHWLNRRNHEELCRACERLHSSSDPAATVEPVMETEVSADPVECWRFDQLVRAGWDVESAMIVTMRNDIDLRHACDLVANGCDPELALRILL